MANKKRHFGLRAKFTILVSCLLLLTYVLITFFLIRNAQKNDIRNINLDTTAFATLATPQVGNTYGIYKDSGTIVIDEQVNNYLGLDKNITNVSVVDLMGNVAYQSNQNVKVPATTNSSSFETQYVYLHNGLISRIIVPYFSSSGQHPYSVSYQVNTGILAKDNEQQLKTIILFSAVGLIITAGVMYELITRFYVKPIEKMSSEAIVISQGNYNSVIDLERNDEIGDLAISVNTMSEKLKADIAALQEVDRLKNEFISITSHNLRTPLSIIEGNVELLSSESLAKDATDQIASIGKSSSELASLIEDMLAISTIEAGQTSIHKSNTKINSLVEPIRERFAKSAKDKGVQLEWYIPAPDTSVSIDRSYTRGILTNLIDNAIKFTNNGGRVDCQILVENNILSITVKDTGIGIAAEEQAKLFTKFHRGTSTLEYNYSGRGIGLYVTKLMTEAQNGSISVQSEPNKGSVFKVTLPLINPSA